MLPAITFYVAVAAALMVMESNRRRKWLSLSSAWKERGPDPGVLKSHAVYKAVAQDFAPQTAILTGVSA
jgi:hypothetical protein